MVFSRAVKVRRPTVVWALLASGLVLEGWVLQAQKPEPIPPPVLVASGTARLLLGAEERELTYAATAAGPLFGLDAIARELGGRLTETASGRGYELTFSASKFLLATESPQVVSGKKILTLSQRPVTLDGTLLVPLDMLEVSFGQLAGYVWRFEETTRTLHGERPNITEVEAAIDLVHLQGTSTLVVKFPAGPPRYVVEREGQRTELRLLGGAFSRQTELPRVEDPLVSALRLGLDRLTIELAPGVDGELYELKQQPFRLVFDFHQVGPATSSPATAELPLPRPSNGFTVVLDPGHGGGETGALGKNGAVEKELTLLLSLEIQRQLEAALPVKVILTRSADEQVGLFERTAIANENKADLLVSVHLNSSLSGRPFGAETYFLSLKASDLQAAAAAELENQDADDAEESDDLEMILWDLAQTRHLAQSQTLATLIQGELNATLGLKDRGVKQAPFKVLVGAQMPAVLVELGFLSNAEEEAQLKDASHRARLAAALVKAIVEYRAPQVTPGVASPGSTPEAQATPPTEPSAPPGASRPER